MTAIVINGTKEFIRIGLGYPRISLVDDRWGLLKCDISTNYPCYIETQKWVMLNLYQSPIEPFDYELDEIEQLNIKLSSPLHSCSTKDFDKIIDTKWGERIKNVMSLSGDL